MTNDILSPADPQIVELFKHGKCLTFDFSRDVKNVSVAMQKTAGRCGRVVCSTAPLALKQDTQLAFFADGNVCLTAGRDEKIDPACRSYLALFADGRLIVSDLYQTNRYGIYDYRKVSQFARTYSDYLYLQPQYVPQSYLDALYRRAEQYGWYISAEEAAAAMPVQPLPTAEENAACDAFVKEIFKGRRCISVAPRELSLMMADDVPDYAAADIEKELTKHFPDLHLKTQQAPQAYVDAIYRMVPQMQKSTKQIYFEILKQKARKLGKRLNLPRHRALETVAQMAGWQSWKQATRIDEERAKFVLVSEKNKKELARFFIRIRWKWNIRNI